MDRRAILAGVERFSCGLINTEPFIHIEVVERAALLSPVIPGSVALLRFVGRELGYFVSIGSPVHREIPGEVSSLDQIGRQLELHTDVHHVHVVHQLACRISLRRGERTIVNHILGLLDEEVRVHRKPVEKARLEAGVEVIGFLPRHVRSGPEHLHDGSLAIHAVNPVEILIDLCHSNVVISLSSVACLELEVVHPRHRKKERLLLRVPRCSDGPETAPSLVRGKP